MKRTITTALALLALVVVAAPATAAAKPPQTLHYEGETDGGQEISYDLTGKRISNFDGYIAVTCVPTHGTPLTFSDEFNPPGSFVLGKSGKASNSEYMAYKGDVTRNFTVDIKPAGKRWKVGLHVNYSYEQVMGTSGLELEKYFYICQGDDSFSFKVEAPQR